MGKGEDRRVETLAMRISKSEHVRLKALAESHGMPEAEVVRRAVNDWAASRELGPVFDTKG